jgi:mersacidin/lichenicidin family type 2 lantibiotic
MSSPTYSVSNPDLRVQADSAIVTAGDRELKMVAEETEMIMKKRDVIRAWRDGEFYSSLSNEERAALPDSPASVIDLGDDVLASISGGCASYYPCPSSAYCTPCPPKYCF